MKTDNQMVFFQSLDTLAQKLHKSFDEIKNMMEGIFRESYNKKFDPDADIRLDIDIDNKKIKLFNKTVEVVEDDYEMEENEKTMLIHLKDARKINPKVQIEDYVTQEIDFSLFERDIIVRIGQLLRQKVRETTKEYLFEKYKDLKGTMIDAVPRSIKPDRSVIFNLPDDEQTAYMPSNYNNPLLTLKVGVPTKVFVHDVLPEARDEQIILSLSSPQFVEDILKDEVPEIQDGTVKVLKIVRIAGLRAKVIVSSNSRMVDPIASCIGVRGIRITGIIERLKGEKIDIIKHSDDQIEFVKDIMTPSAIVSIKVQENNTLLVIVPDKHLSLAIGRQGSNVKLVYQLIENKVDIKSYTKAIEEEIEFEWNGNINADELKRIEDGERVMFRNVNKKQVKKFTFQDNFDDDIHEFNSAIFDDNFDDDVQDTHIELEPVDINMDEEFQDDSMFSEDELRKMEQDFGFDEEMDLSSFDEFNDEENE